MTRPPDPRFADWLIGGLRSGLLAVDASGALVALNDEARRILGGPAREARPGEPLTRVLAEQPALAGVLAEALEGHERPSRAELVLEPGGGSEALTIGFSVAPVRDPEGALRGAALLFRDLTPFERRDEQERLRDRLAALGQMAAGLAHELRNPLASLEVLAGLLERRLGHKAEDRELLDDLKREIRSLGASVEASLDFVKSPFLARAPLDLAALLEECLSVARTRVPFAGVVERDLEPGLPPLTGDREQLRSVLINLLVNAFEAMDEPGARREPRLHLALRRLDGAGPAFLRLDRRGREAGDTGPRAELELQIEDTGPGVSPELRERIFYPFFTTRHQGSGVGLAMAAKIAASHGGSISVGEGRDGGACFRLRLPLVAPAPGCEDGA